MCSNISRGYYSRALTISFTTSCSKAIISRVASNRANTVVYHSIIALDGAARGTKLIQTPFKAMSTLVFGTRSCVLCGEHIDLNYSYFEHLCDFNLSISIILVCGEVCSFPK